MEEKPKKKRSKKVWIPIVVLVLLAVLFVPVLAEFIATGLVPRFPTLIVSTVMMVCALLMLVCGLVLDTVAKKHRQLFEINLNILNMLHKGETK